MSAEDYLKYAEDYDAAVKVISESLRIPMGAVLEELENLEEYKEESYKRSLWCSGFLKNPVTGFYHSIRYSSDYDWGALNYTIDLRPRKLVEETVTVVQKKFHLC